MTVQQGGAVFGLTQIVPGAHRSAVAQPCDASTKRSSLKNAPSIRASAAQVFPPSCVRISPVSVVANPTFASSRWIGPVSLVDGGTVALALGRADASRGGGGEEFAAVGAGDRDRGAVMGAAQVAISRHRTPRGEAVFRIA